MSRSLRTLPVQYLEKVSLKFRSMLYGNEKPWLKSRLEILIEIKFDKHEALRSTEVNSNGQYQGNHSSNSCSTEVELGKNDGVAGCSAARAAAGAFTGTSDGDATAGA